MRLYFLALAALPSLASAYTRICHVAHAPTPPPTPVPPTPPPTPPKPPCIPYGVQHGDSCSAIKAFFGVEYSAIWDKGVPCPDANLFPGDIAYVCNPTQNNDCIPYKIASGDTCAGLANFFGTSMDKITMDGKKCADVAKSLKVGDLLEVCGCTTECDTIPWGPEPAPAPPPPTPPTPPTPGPTPTCLHLGDNCDPNSSSSVCCSGLHCKPDPTFGGFCVKNSDIATIATQRRRLRAGGKRTATAPDDGCCTGCADGSGDCKSAFGVCIARSSDGTCKSGFPDCCPPGPTPPTTPTPPPTPPPPSPTPPPTPPPPSPTPPPTPPPPSPTPPPPPAGDKYSCHHDTGACFKDPEHGTQSQDDCLSTCSSSPTPPTPPPPTPPPPSPTPPPVPTLPPTPSPPAPTGDCADDGKNCKTCTTGSHGPCKGADGSCYAYPYKDHVCTGGDEDCCPTDVPTPPPTPPTPPPTLPPTPPTPPPAAPTPPPTPDFNFGCSADNSTCIDCDDGTSGPCKDPTTSWPGTCFKYTGTHCVGHAVDCCGGTTPTPAPPPPSPELDQTKVTFNLEFSDSPSSYQLKLCYDDECKDSAPCDSPISGGLQTVTFDSSASAWQLVDDKGETRMWHGKSDISGWAKSWTTCNALDVSRCSHAYGSE